MPFHLRPGNRFGAAAEDRELVFQARCGKLPRDPPEHGAGIIFDHVADQDAESGERAGQRRNHHPRDAERFRQFAGVQSACAAKRNQGKLPRIVAAFDGDHAYGFLHGGVDDPDDSRGELFRRKLGPMPFEPFADQAACALEVQSEISAEKALRLQPAEKQVGIRHRGLGAAAVADRAGIGSGGFGTDPQRSGGVEAGDGAAARADGVNVEHGHANGQSGNLGLAAGAASPSTSATSVEVPPISKEMIRSKPLRRAMAAAPTTPPAGPESTVRTGSRAAERRPVIPPLDCMTKIRD